MLGCLYIKLVNELLDHFLTTHTIVRFVGCEFMCVCMCVCMYVCVAMCVIHSAGMPCTYICNVGGVWPLPFNLGPFL